MMPEVVEVDGLPALKLQMFKQDSITGEGVQGAYNSVYRFILCSKVQEGEQPACPHGVMIHLLECTTHTHLP